MTQVIYTCYRCEKEFKPEDVPELVEFTEEGDFDNPCPVCGDRLIWGIK